MNTRFLIIRLIIIGLLAACAPSTPLPIEGIPTATPFRVLTPTQTATQSVTALPTIPTFTPTFDVSTIVTAAPAVAAVCPKEDASVKIDFLIPQNGYGYSGFSAFSCDNGEYDVFWIPDSNRNSAPLTSGAYLFTIRDLNKNNLPDTVLKDRSVFLVSEWDGLTFKNIALDQERLEWPSIHSETRPAEIKDTNEDGFDELILTGADVYYYGFNESY